MFRGLLRGREKGELDEEVTVHRVIKQDRYQQGGENIFINILRGLLPPYARKGLTETDFRSKKSRKMSRNATFIVISDGPTAVQEPDLNAA
jgi:hypothetical protein